VTSQSSLSSGIEFALGKSFTVATRKTQHAFRRGIVRHRSATVPPHPIRKLAWVSTVRRERGPGGNPRLRLSRRSRRSTQASRSLGRVGATSYKHHSRHSCHRGDGDLQSPARPRYVDSRRFGTGSGVFLRQAAVPQFCRGCDQVLVRAIDERSVNSRRLRFRTVGVSSEPNVAPDATRGRSRRACDAEDRNKSVGHPRSASRVGGSFRDDIGVLAIGVRQCARASDYAQKTKTECKSGLNAGALEACRNPLTVASIAMFMIAAARRRGSYAADPLTSKLPPRRS